MKQPWLFFYILQLCKLCIIFEMKKGQPPTKWLTFEYDLK